MGPLRSRVVRLFKVFPQFFTAIDLLTLRKQYAIMSPHRQRGLLAHERGLLSKRSQSLPGLTPVRRQRYDGSRRYIKGARRFIKEIALQVTISCSQVTRTRLSGMRWARPGWTTTITSGSRVTPFNERSGKSAKRNRPPGRKAKDERLYFSSFSVYKGPYGQFNHRVIYAVGGLYSGRLSGWRNS